MNGVRETIALPLAFGTCFVLWLAFDYWASGALADSIDFFRGLVG